MPKKRAKKGRARKVTKVKDLKASRGGEMKGGMYNPKELQIDKSVAWQRGSG
jgi:hypothetical protein